MMFLGTPGRLVGVKCPVAQRVTPADGYSFQETLEGRVKAQVVPGRRRTWDVELGDLTTPAEVATLMEFAQGAWGQGPFWFVSADAAVVNLLTPAASSCDPAEVQMGSNATLLGSPPLNLGADGWAARSVWKDTANGAAIGSAVPVLPDVPVTSSAYVVGSGRLRLQFLDATGAAVSSHDSAGTGAAMASRVHVTAVPPSGAVAVRLWVTASVTHVARPAITWTDQPYEFGDGQGCEKAVVHAVSRGVIKA